MERNENYLKYRWAKVRENLRKKYHPLILLARLRQHKYAQIVPLGTNCEVAFRFYFSWGFLDSSLLAWAQTFNLKTVCHTLDHLDLLFAGKATLHESSRMWVCEHTGTYFHGHVEWDMSEEAQRQDLADLRGRLEHLKRKLREYLSNDLETLVVHRLSEEDERSEDLDRRLGELEAALARLGARNCTLLVVCERPYLPRMPAGPGRVFRPVAKFNPRDQVTIPEAGDTLGWRAIYTEFAPAKILPKRHAFKFE